MAPMLKIMTGDALACLKTLESGSVQTCVTSPPYFGLRAYGTEPQVWGGDLGCEHSWDTEHVKSEMRRGVNLAQSAVSTRGGAKKIAEVGFREFDHSICSACGAWRGELGSEPTPELYVEHMVLIFRELRRVLRDDGTLWLNIGDSYAGSWGAQSRRETPATISRHQINNHPKRASHTGTIRSVGLKPKDLIGIPWLLAFALRADGWYLRSEIIWHKPNPMPESVTDRPTKAHEQIFLLTKSPRYFYDAEAVMEPSSPSAHLRISQDLANQIGSHRANGGNKTNGPMKAVGRKALQGEVGVVKHNASFDSSVCMPVTMRNKRSVWTVATQSYSDAHFATFAEALIRPCILAGSSARGCCAKCGAPWTRIVEKVATANVASAKGSTFNKGKTAVPHPTVGQGERYEAGQTIGWQASCKCEAEVIPCTVLDPFAGSGTTGKVALELGRKAVLIELNPEYVKLIEKRCTTTLGLPM